MPDNDNSEDQKQQSKQRLFRVKLIQTVPEHEVVSEVFNYAVDNKKLALREAQDFIDDEKDLEKGSYRLEAEEVKEDSPDEPSE